jgi:hypothetical protein
MQKGGGFFLTPSPLPFYISTQTNLCANNLKQIKIFYLKTQNEMACGVPYHSSTKLFISFDRLNDKTQST